MLLPKIMPGGVVGAEKNSPIGEMADPPRLGRGAFEHEGSSPSLGTVRYSGYGEKADAARSKRVAEMRGSSNLPTSTQVRGCNVPESA